MINQHQHHHPEVDSGTTDPVTAGGVSDHPPNNDTTGQSRIRFMRSFGGKILPRPHDNQHRYVGGDTRIITVLRHTPFSTLLSKLSKLSGTTDITVKYQLPNEDLDALITVTSDEDVDNMMEEFDRLAHNHKTARLRLFLFPVEGISRTSSISSLLDGSTKREHWFLDALNGGLRLERGRSEVSSIMSEMPDYLFGLDSSDDPPRDPKPKNRALGNDNISVLDPVSPPRRVSSPLCPTSSSLGPGNLPPLPDLRPVKVRSDTAAVPELEPKEAMVESHVMETGETILKQSDYSGTWQYIQQAPSPGPQVQNMPFYYISGQLSPGNVPIHSVAIRTPYGQPFPPRPGQMPVGLHQPVPNIGQVYGGPVRTIVAGDPYGMSGRLGDGANQPVYIGVRNMGGQAYPDLVVMNTEEMQGSGTDPKVAQAP